MSKKLTLSIATPCHEDWNKMSDDAKGKFCGACQKEVIDFTGMSESQLVAFFKKPAGSVCGRFRVEQLDQQMNIPKKRIPWIRYFFTISLPAFLFSMKAVAQSKTTIGDTVFVPRQPKQMMLGKVSKLPEEIALRGTIKDEQGDIVPFATVMVKDSKIGVAADVNGFFSIKTNLKFPVTLIVSAAGYEATEIEKTYLGNTDVTLNRAQSLDEIVIQNSNHIMLGGISSSIFVEETSVTKSNLVEEKENTGSIGKLVVYPNPVRKRNSFTVDARKMPAGAYKVNITDLSGKIIQSREVIVRDGSAFSFNLGDVAGGTYVVSFISRKTGEMISQQLVLK
jgi:hypothetical protein